MIGTQLLIVIVVLIFMLSATNAGAADESRVLSIDAQKTIGPMNTMWRRCVGAGRANEGLRADWQAQLKQLHDECGFEYVRFHGLLCDDMGVYSEDEHGNPRHNFQYIDALFDGMLAAGVRPFVEVGFMPGPLGSGKTTIFWWKGNTTMPKSWEKWDGLIKDLTRHWIERYGVDEVRKWYFEIWNEPNYGDFFVARDPDHRMENYFELYDHTVRAIKSVDPALRVGGPATAGPSWLKETVDYCDAHNTPLDFISYHCYGIDEGPGGLDEFGKKLLRIDSNVSGLGGLFRKFRGVIDETGRKGIETHITEWSASYSPRDPVHDSIYMPPYILEQLKVASDAVTSMSYWVFTDIFEEAGIPMTPFHGGFGLMTIGGVRKPAYFAFNFLNRLGPTQLQCDDPHAWATRDQKGGVQVLLWDLRFPMPPKTSNQDFFTKELKTRDLPPARVRIAGLTPGDYDLKVYRVGHRANDAYTPYLADMNAPAQLTRAQTESLKKSAAGQPEIVQRITVGPDGTLDRELPMRELDCVLVTATRVE